MPAEINPASIRANGLTQTYSTSDVTHPALTSTDLATTAATNVAPFGFATQAQADNIATQFNLLRADLLALKKFVNALVDTME